MSSDPRRIAIPTDKFSQLGDAVMELDENSNCEETPSFEDEASNPDIPELSYSMASPSESTEMLEAEVKCRAAINGEVNVTLWQFLLELLVSGQYHHVIQWTNREGEFQLLRAEEVARLWGMRKNKNHRMNYDKLSRALRYYYQKNIIKKVQGQKFVYRFVGLSESALAASRNAISNRKRKWSGSIVPSDMVSLERPSVVNDLVSDPAINFGTLGSIGKFINSGNSTGCFGNRDLTDSNKPCCSCRCHSSKSNDDMQSHSDVSAKKVRVAEEVLVSVKTEPVSSSGTDEAREEEVDHKRFSNFLPSSEPNMTSPRHYFQWLATEVERANSSLSTRLHTNRHEANMKKLSEQIRMQKLWRHDLFAPRESDTPPASSRQSFSSFLDSVPGIPATNPYLTNVTGMAPCVWMPVPLSMVSQVWPDVGQGLSQSTSTENSHSQRDPRSNSN